MPDLGQSRNVMVRDRRLRGGFSVAAQPFSASAVCVRSGIAGQLRAADIVIAIVVIFIHGCDCSRPADKVRSSGARARRSSLALVIVDPRFERIDLLVDQIVELRSAMAHSRDVVHRQKSLPRPRAPGSFRPTLIARGLPGETVESNVPCMTITGRCRSPVRSSLRKLPLHIPRALVRIP